MNKINDITKKWLVDNYGDLEKFETSEYPNRIFYMKDGNVIIDYNQKNGYCYISYYEIWSFLESVFQLEDEEIQDITKEWVEEHHKLRVTTTYLGLRETISWWRNTTNAGSCSSILTNS